MHWDSAVAHFIAACNATGYDVTQLGRDP
jgi:hypothetical protein